MGRQIPVLWPTAPDGKKSQTAYLAYLPHLPSSAPTVLGFVEALWQPLRSTVLATPKPCKSPRDRFLRNYLHRKSVHRSPLARHHLPTQTHPELDLLAFDCGRS